MYNSISLYLTLLYIFVLFWEFVKCFTGLSLARHAPPKDEHTSTCLGGTFFFYLERKSVKSHMTSMDSFVVIHLIHQKQISVTHTQTKL